MKNWVEKYAPQKVVDVVGHDTEMRHLLDFIKKKDVVLLHGPAGVGKTVGVYALARELGYEIIEVNASDFRNADSIEGVVGGALQQQSLFSKGKIVLVDELDGISGRKDRGGVSALQKLITDKHHAVVLVANDPWDKKLSTLRKKCKLLPFKKVRIESIVKVLSKICKEENITVSVDVLKTLARKCGGDVRAAVNDLQGVGFGKKEITAEDLDVVSEREQEGSIFEGLRVIFKGTNAVQSLSAFDNVDVDLKDIGLWIEENLPLEYSGMDLMRGFDSLSKAYVFFGRIPRKQYWRFLVYSRMFLTAGISTSKEKASYGFTPYKRYQRILKMWMSNQKNFKKKEISLKIHQEAHCSTRRAAQDYVPFLKVMAKQDITFPFLTEEHMEWLKK